MLWYTNADFTHMVYMPPSLSDHTPLLLHTTDSPRPPPVFQFYDMWVKDPAFLTIVRKHLPLHISDPLPQLCQYLYYVQRDLCRFSRSKFKDLQQQLNQSRAQLDSLQLALATQPTDAELLQQEKHSC